MRVCDHAWGIRGEARIALFESTALSEPTLTRQGFIISQEWSRAAWVDRCHWLEPPPRAVDRLATLHVVMAIRRKREQKSQDPAP